MPRRRLRLQYSSDEEEEDDDEQQETSQSNHNPAVTEQPATASSSPPPPNPSPDTSNPADPVAISDEDLTDIPGDLNPSSPPTAAAALDGSGGSPIEEFLLRMGLRLRREWLESCIRGMESSVPRFQSLDTAAKAKLCFEQFLLSDMNYCGGGVLPPNVVSMHLVDLTGPFVLQVDEIVNISCPLKGRFQDAAPGLKRCLKLSMTDGVQRVFGMEYRPIKDLKVLSPAGLKVVLSNVQIRHGLVMLVPEVIEVLGGMVEELDEARKRLVVEVNKPPRGRRTRTGVAPSLATRATLSAWSSSGGIANGHFNSSTSENATLVHANGQGNSSNASRTEISWRIVEESPGSVALENTDSHVEDMHSDTVHTSEERVISRWPSNIEPDFDDIHIVTSRTSEGGSTRRASSAHSNGEDTTDNNNHGENNTDHQTYNVTSHVEEMHIDTVPDRNTPTVSGPDSNVMQNVEVIDMVEDVESPPTLSRNVDVPFTYLSLLSAKWVAMKDNVPSVRGKIKCFLTGVKSFQYKQRATYELLCYVDDGSLISEIMIDHNVVEKGIGHSPEEVCTALSSSDPKIVSGVKETLRQFQTFLANFEGIMLVEINETSSHPIALEMCQGCPASDAWLFLERLKRTAPRIAPTDPIDISP